MSAALQEKIVKLIIDIAFTIAGTVWAWNLWHAGDKVPSLLILIILQLSQIRAAIENKPEVTNG